MNYSNINNTEHFFKFKLKKVGKKIGKVGKGAVKGAVKVAPGALKSGLKVFSTVNPLSITTGIFGGNKTMSYVCSALVCLILVAIILFQLKN